MSGEHLLMVMEASHTKHLRKQAAAVWRSQPGHHFLLVFLWEGEGRQRSGEEA